VWGTARAAREAGDAALARTAYQELLALAGGGSRQSVIQEARDYLVSGR
jgi:hypothetical protein